MNDHIERMNEYDVDDSSTLLIRLKEMRFTTVVIIFRMRRVRGQSTRANQSTNNNNNSSSRYRPSLSFMDTVVIVFVRRRRRRRDSQVFANLLSSSSFTTSRRWTSSGCVWLRFLLLFASTSLRFNVFPVNRNYEPQQQSQAKCSLLASTTDFSYALHHYTSTRHTDTHTTCTW